MGRSWWPGQLVIEGGMAFLTSNWDALPSPPLGSRSRVCISCVGEACTWVQLILAGPLPESSLSGSCGRPGNCLIPKSPSQAPPLGPRLLSGTNVPLRMKRTKPPRPHPKLHLTGPEGSLSLSSQRK